MSLKFDLFPIRPLTAAQFWSWLARSEPGAVLEYHRSLLIVDRSPVSELGEEERHLVAKLADAALQAAVEGRVHLLQRRNGGFDFSYLAVKRPILRGLPIYGFVREGGETEHVAAAA